MNTFVPRVRSVPQQEKPRAPPSVLVACAFTYYATREIFCGSRPDHVRFIQHARTSRGIVKLDGVAIELFYGEYRSKSRERRLVIHMTYRRNI